MSHTKGKWGLSVDKLNVSSYLEESSTYVPLAEMAYGKWMEEDKAYPMDCKTAQANARLITAVPDLLEACEEFDKSFFKEGQVNIGKINKARIKAQVAIKKALNLRRKIRGLAAIAKQS